MRAKRHLLDETFKREQLKKKVDAFDPEAGGSPEQLAQRRADVKAVIPRLEAAYNSENEASNDAAVALQEIFILAPLDVVDAAVQWHHHAEANNPQAQSRFLNAARQDAGVEPLSSLPA